MEDTIILLIQGAIAGLYFFLCGQIARIGEKRTIGYNLSLFLSIILTPIIGFIITILCDRKFIDAEEVKNDLKE